MNYFIMEAILLMLLVAGVGHALKVPTISLLQPKGIRFEIEDEDGASIAAVHYNINQGLAGTKAAKWNYDIRDKTDGKWVHENTGVTVNPGDTVNYWIYMIRHGHGKHVTGLSWKAPGTATGTGTSTGTGTGTECQDMNEHCDYWAKAGECTKSADYMLANCKRSCGQKCTTGTTQTGNLRLVIDDDFNGNSLDMSKWTHEVTAGGGGNWEFQVYTPETRNTYLRNGKLYIKPTLTTERFGDSFLTTGVLDLNKIYGVCTSSQWYGCKREGRQGFLNPVMSGKIMSKVAFKYGRMEVMAKLPRGDWLWPAIWLLPKDWDYGGWPMSGEIDLMESRGNRNYGSIGVDEMGSTLHWGTSPGQNRYHMTGKSYHRPGQQTWADGFHKYVLDWDETGIRTYVDDVKVLDVRTPQNGYYQWGNFPEANPWTGGSKAAPFDRRFYVIFNVAVGGTNGFFPDGVRNQPYAKPWKNTSPNAPKEFWEARSNWLPTWQGEDAAMQVEYIKVWEKQ